MSKEKFLTRTPWIVLDFETGDLTPDKGAITQVCCLAIDSTSLEEINAYTAYIKPNYSPTLGYNPKALEYSGITLAKLSKDGKDVKQVVADLKQFFISMNPSPKTARYRPVIVGHNIKFDIPFLETTFQLCEENVYDYISEASICTLQLSTMKWNQDQTMKSFKLKPCCEKAGVQLNQAHDAMEDVFATADLFKFLIKSVQNEGGSVANQEKERFRKSFQF